MLDLLIEIQKNREVINGAEKVIKNGIDLTSMKETKMEFEKEKKNYVELDRKIKKVKSDIDTISEKIDGIKKEIEEDEGKLYSNLKYDLKLIERLEKSIELKKEEVRGMEDRSLELLYEEDELENQKSASREKLVLLRDDFYRQREGNNQKALKSKRNIENSRKRILELEKQVPGNLMEIFNKISKIKGTGAAELSDGVCLGCRMKVSAITMDDVKKNRKIVYCDNCGRIIYCPH